MARCAARGGVAAAEERAGAWGTTPALAGSPCVAHLGRHREVAPNRRTETTIPLAHLDTPLRGQVAVVSTVSGQERGAAVDAKRERGQPCACMRMLSMTPRIVFEAS